MNEPINQHYVSQFYLRKFADPAKPGYVWVTDVKKAYATGTLISEPSVIKHTTAIRHLYSDPDVPEIDKYHIENYFGAIESEAGSVWQRIEGGSVNLERESSDRKTLSRYIAAQHLRGPRLVQVALQHRAHGDNYPFDIRLWTWEDIERFHREVAKMPVALGETTQDLSDRTEFRTLMKVSIDYIADLINERFVWRLLCADEMAFSTSDSPVSIYNSVKDAASTLYDVNATVCFPLTPKRLLWLMHSEVAGDVIAHDGKSVVVPAHLPPMLNAGIFNFSHEMAISPWDMGVAVPQHMDSNWNS